MIDLKILKKISREGLEELKKEKGLIEGLVYVSATDRLIGRIVYMTHLPCSGLEEPKSTSDFGVTVEMWFEKNGKKLLGIGHEANDLSNDGIKRAIEKAKRDAVRDSDFSGFLKADEFEGEMWEEQVDKNTDDAHKIFFMSDQEESELIVKLSWEAIEGAVDVISEFAKEKKKDLGDLSFILNGDNFVIKERMALSTTTGISDSDESAVVISFLTAMLEKDNSKGSAWGASSLSDRYSAYEFGKRAALSAINGRGGDRIPTGKYKVVFGHQAVGELFGSLYIPHMNLGMVDMGASLFNGKYNQKVASELLTIYDDATLPNAAGSRRITCEGFPTGKTVLIDNGRLVGYLSDSRTRNKILNRRERGRAVLGVDPHEIRQAISPRNGFRFSGIGGRTASASIGIHGTNLVIDSKKAVEPGELLKRVDNGIFIGRLWYTYPIGGYSSGIITGTAIAECYKIKNGKLDEPIMPNTLRLEDNIGEMAKNIIGIANNKMPTVLWMADELTYAPWVAMNNVSFHEINED